MQPQVSKIFGSYDLFAKAFPGILFISLSISILPAPPIENFPRSSGVLVAVLALFVIIFGFVAGQALHAVAVQVESIVLKIAEILYNIKLILKILFNMSQIYYNKIKIYVLSLKIKDEGSEEARDHDEETKDLDEEASEEDEISTAKLIVGSVGLLLTLVQIGYYVYAQQLGAAIILFFAFLFPINRIKNGAIQTFYPHRRLFEDKISEGGDSINKFTSLVEDLFDVDAKENPELAYQLVMSYYERITVGRSRQHQANFSFCRSTWTTLLLFSPVYLVIADPNIAGLIPLVGPFISGYLPLEYSPIIAELAPNTTVKLVGIVMLASVVLFMEGERQGKKAFTEYVFIDILTINERDLPESTRPNN